MSDTELHPPIRICLPSDTLEHLSVDTMGVPSVNSIAFGCGTPDSNGTTLFSCEDDLIKHKSNIIDQPPLFMQLNIVVSLCSMTDSKYVESSKPSRSNNDVQFEISFDDELTDVGDVHQCPSEVPCELFIDERPSNTRAYYDVESESQNDDGTSNSEEVRSPVKIRTTRKLESNSIEPLLNDDFVCAVCGSSFKSSSNLKNHINTVHDQKKDFRCAMCDATFTKNNHLKFHVKSVHDKIKDKICQICSRGFSKQSYLTDHINAKHGDEEMKKFKCDLCSYRCLKRFHLNNHIKLVHEKQRPFPCQLCSKQFASKHTLRVHVKSTHDQVRDEMCSVCGVAFACNRRLMLHIKHVHEQLRDYRCSHCKAVFNDKGDLARHLETEHGGCPNYRCSLCPMTTMFDASLRKHMRTVHGGVIESVDDVQLNGSNQQSIESVSVISPIVDLESVLQMPAKN